MTTRSLSSSTLNMKFMQRGNLAAKNGPEKSSDKPKPPVYTPVSNTTAAPVASTSKQRITVEPSYLAFPHLIGKKSKKTKKAKDENVNIDEAEDVEMQDALLDSSEDETKPTATPSLPQATPAGRKPIVTPAKPPNKPAGPAPEAVFKRPAGFEEIKPQKFKNKKHASSDDSDDAFVTEMLDAARAKRKKQ